MGKLRSLYELTELVGSKTGAKNHISSAQCSGHKSFPTHATVSLGTLSNLETPRCITGRLWELGREPPKMVSLPWDPSRKLLGFFFSSTIPTNVLLPIKLCHDCKFTLKFVSMKRGWVWNTKHDSEPHLHLLSHIHLETHSLDSHVLSASAFEGRGNSDAFFTPLFLCRAALSHSPYLLLILQLPTQRSPLLWGTCVRPVSHGLLGCPTQWFPLVTSFIIPYFNFTCFTCSGQRPFLIFLFRPSA